MSLRLLLVAGIVLLSGCASFPDSIQTADNAPLLSYAEVAGHPQETTGKQVRWGGVIASVTNLPERTQLEILHYPLRNYGRPMTSNDSQGRFRVYVKGFLDPMVYEQGRAITVLGVAQGVEQGMVGEHPYVFPTVEASGYHLWTDKKAVRVESLNMWPYYPYYGWPYRAFPPRIIIHSRPTGPTGPSTPPAKPPKPQAK
ncbi:Slp family lipoprotein [Aestuariibacter halophilus]|uniref:Slp family lipoprotein n=1 Tax=Fluctibacter halophilus TaxID=226011 RepID=A0ABS8G6N9_9ALTE|nr:Slp family lipoprotein [Aestuariibacter halophilus]MCC2616262.1 Slp family lipoprotein [Aestuariibacter halophilus]